MRAKLAQRRCCPGAALLQGMPRARRGLARKQGLLPQPAGALLVQLWLPCK